MIEVLADLGLKALITTGVKEAIEWGKKALSPQPTYQEQLLQLVERFLDDEYRGKHPKLPGDKFYFWQSKWAKKWAVSYRFDEPETSLRLEDIPLDIPLELEHMVPSTQTELDDFSARFNKWIAANDKLRKLYETENPSGAMFRLKARNEEQMSEVTEHLAAIRQSVEDAAAHTSEPDQQAQTQRVRQAIEQVSLGLANADHTIPNLGVHLDRNETQRILTWLVAPLQAKEEPLGVLAGGAGMGKTAIMRDVLEALRAQGVATLALKADRLFASTYAELTQKILTGTGATDLGSVLQLLRPAGGGAVVVLIDQLDALSQSLSANRELLRSYRELIQFLLHQPEVRVVLSCRTFDLETDPLLQTYTGKTRFDVQPLSHQDVDGVVVVSVFAGQPLASPLYTLLTVPLHLRIFCQLSGATELSGITTLQALYDELYGQRVLRPTTLGAPNEASAPAKLQALLAELAAAMYEEQRLSVSALRSERLYPEEVRYALSQNLLVPARAGKHLQFFHQSFFDYLFARQFVESGQQLSDLLDAGHQGLFIRSAVRQVLEYLRAFDNQQYLQHLKQLLLHPAAYRLHIRLLVLQQFGQLNAPTPAEQYFAKQHLVGSAENRELFLESVRTPSWGTWLVGQSVPQGLVQQPNDLTSSEKNLLWYLSREQPASALETLKQVVVNEHAGPRAAWMLMLADKTTEVTYESVFARFAPWMMAHSSYYFTILDSRAAIAPAPTAVRLFEALKGQTGYSPDHNQTQMGDWHPEYALEELMKASAAIGFALLKRLLEHWIESTRTDQQPKHRRLSKNTSIISDREFALHDPKGRHTHSTPGKVYDLAQQHLEEVARQNPAQARELLAEWPLSSLRSLLQLTSATYLSHPTAFAADAYTLLMRPNLLQDACRNGHLNYYLRALITQHYALFTPDERTALHRLILKITLGLRWDRRSTPIERSATQVNRHLFTAYGELAYGYLAAIPNVETTTDSEVKRRYQELYRRFGVVENKAPVRMSIRAGHPSPLLADKTQLMQAADWLGAFRQHQQPTDRFMDDYRLGLARHFGVEAEAHPERMTPIVELLLHTENQDIHQRYLQQGLIGLAEATVLDSVCFSDFVLRGVANGQLDLDDTNSIHLLEKCVVNGRTAGKVVELLAEITVRRRHDHCATTNENLDELMDGINTVGGHAVGGLLHCYRMTEYTALIVDALEQVAADASLSVRAATVYQLALLLHLYRPATKPVATLFVKLIGSNYRLLRHPTPILRGLIEAHLPELEPLFTAALAEPACHEQVAQTLTLAWLWDVDTAYEQLQTYWQQSAKAREKSLHFLMHDYPLLSASQKRQAQQAFRELLVYEGPELAQAHAFAFYRLKEADFQAWLPLVREYVAAPVGQGRDRAFYKFLQLSVQEYPTECIELAAAFDNHALPNIQLNDLDKKPLELLLSAYHVLTEMDRDSTYLEVAMKTFDRMLQLPAYRLSASEALTLLDRY